MSNKYLLVIVISLVLSLFSSCLKDNTTIVYHDDVAITGFSLGEMKRTVHTTSSKGQDSTYTVTVKGNSYSFSIDHVNGLIYNVDSLPENTRLTAVIPTVSTYKSGVVFIRSLTSDSLTVLTSTDSVDFSKPRVLVVLSNDGMHNKEYTVNVRVHQEKENHLYWTKKTTDATIGSLSDIRSFALNGKMYVYGVNGAVKMMSSSATDGAEWQNVAVPFATLPSVVANKDEAYALADGKLYQFNGGREWQAIADATGIKTLVAAMQQDIYALTEDGRMVVSSDAGSNWQYDKLDSQASFLPQNNINCVSQQSKVNSDVQNLILVGTRDNKDDKTAMVWSKLIDTTMPQYSQSWTFQPFQSDTWHHIPNFDRLSVVACGEGLFLLGATQSADVKNADAFSFLYSWDGGLNWWKESVFTLPTTMLCSPSSFAMATDSEKNIWIVCGGSGEIWKGHYSTWSWK